MNSAGAEGLVVVRQCGLDHLVGVLGAVDVLDLDRGVLAPRDILIGREVVPALLRDR